MSVLEFKIQLKTLKPKFKHKIPDFEKRPLNNSLHSIYLKVS